MAESAGDLTANFAEIWKMQCDYVLPRDLHSMTWVPTAGRRKPHQRTGQQSIAQQAHRLPPSDACSGGGPDAHDTSCVCGAARTTRYSYPCAKVAMTHSVCSTGEGPPTLTASRKRSQKTRISAEIRACPQLHCLPPTTNSRAFASRNTPS